jgi:hypothetical protein
VTNIVIYTAITGRISDELRVPTGDGTRPAPGVRWVCFTDREKYGTRYGPWVVHKPVWTHPSVPRRTARWHKASAHTLFPDADVSLWCDGCFQLHVYPLDLVAYLKDTDVATFYHPDRDCIYDEEVACRRLKKDFPEVMAAQTARYRAENYPPHNGLAETTCVLRRHTPQVAELNTLWWSEMDRGSLRDQLSFDYCCWKLGMRYSKVGGCRGQNPYFRFYPHREL